MHEMEVPYRLILADGTVLDDCTCGCAGKTLWCFLKNVSFSEAFRYFSGPEKFETVIFDILDVAMIDRTYYSGLESITEVRQMDDGRLKIELTGAKIAVREERLVNSKVGET